MKNIQSLLLLAPLLSFVVAPPTKDGATKGGDDYKVKNSNKGGDDYKVKNCKVELENPCQPDKMCEWITDGKDKNEHGEKYKCNDKCSCLKGSDKISKGKSFEIHSCQKYAKTAYVSNGKDVLHHYGDFVWACQKTSIDVKEKDYPECFKDSKKPTGVPKKVKHVEPTGGAKYTQPTGAAKGQDVKYVKPTDESTGAAKEKEVKHVEPTGGAKYTQPTGGAIEQPTGGVNYTQPTGGANYTQPTGDAMVQPVDVKTQSPSQGHDKDEEFDVIVAEYEDYLKSNRGARKLKSIFEKMKEDV
jgi:hypothetical protein